jgi:hypothetical protein
MVLKLKKLSFTKIKQKILSNKKHSIVFGIIFLMTVVIFFQNVKILDSIVVGGSDIEFEIQAIRKLQKKLKLGQNKVRIIKEKKESLIQKSREFWILDRDGQANINIQKKIESAGKQSNIELKTLGTLRLSPTGNGVSNGEFDVTCSGDLKSIVQFINEVSEMRPKVYWERCLLRPDNIKNPKKIYLTGYLKFIILENKDIINLLQEKNAK